MAGKSLKTRADIVKYASEHYSEGGSIIVECYDQEQLQDIIDGAAKRKVSVRTVCKEIMGANSQPSITARVDEHEMTDEEFEAHPRMAYRVVERTSEQVLLATDDLAEAVRLFQATEGSMVTDRDGNELPRPVKPRTVPPAVSEDRDAREQPTRRKRPGGAPETTQKIVRKRAEAETDRVAVITLTDNQRRFIAALADEPFFTGMSGFVWIDCFADTLEAGGVMGRMAAGAMVSTLREKGLITVTVGAQPTAGGRTRKAKYFEFTDVGVDVVRAAGILREEADD